MYTSRFSSFRWFALSALLTVCTASATMYVPGGGGGGGTTSPGGSNGQLQYNNGGSFGGYTIGSGLSVTAGTLSATGTAGVSTFNSRTGTVVPATGDYTFAQIGSTPTTLAGYGIGDAYTKTAADARYAPISVVGTVTSVALSLPSFLTVSGSPVTSTGTLTGTLATQAVGSIFAGPSSGGVAAPTFRALAATDVPTLNQSTTGNAGTATALATARAINGVNFDGTAPITVAAAGSTLTGTSLAANILSSALTSTGTLATLTVTAPIAGSTTGNEVPLTFSTGLTRTTNTITANAVSLATSGSGGVTGTLPVTSGGTGLATLGTLPAFNGSALTNVPAVSVGGVTITGTPSIGQVPTATSTTAATWQSPSGGGGSGGPAFYATGLIGQYALSETSGTVATDSSGAGNNGTYVGSPTLNGDGFLSAGGTKYVTLPSAVWTAWQTALICADTNSSVFANSNNAAVFGGSSNSALILYLGTNGAHGGNTMTTFTDNTSTWEQAPGGQVCYTLVNDTASTANTQFFINDHEVAIYNGTQGHTAGRVGTGQLGAGGGTNQVYFNGQIYYAAFWNTRLSTQRIAQNYNVVRQLLLNRGHLFLPNNYTATANQINVIGDSIAYGLGLGSPSTQSWPRVLSTTDTYTVVDNGISSEQVYMMQNNCAPTGSFQYAPQGGRNVAIFNGGANNLDNAGTTTASIVAQIRSCAQQLRAQGWKVIITDVISRTTQDAGKNFHNNLLRQTWRQFADEYVPLGSDPYMGIDGSSANATYFQADGVHPTTAGQLVMAQNIGAAINRLATNYSFASNAAVFTQTTPTTLTNSTTKTNLAATGVPAGGATLPVYNWYPGKSMTVRGRGIISTATVTPGNFTLNLELGSVTLATTGASALTTNLANAAVEYDMTVTCLTMGSKGSGATTNSTFWVQGNLRIAGTSFPMVNTTTQSVDTSTSATLLAVTATFSTASATNTITNTNQIMLPSAQ